MSEPLDLASQLCVSCGLCCDGTIYSMAPFMEGDTDEQKSWFADNPPTPGMGEGWGQPCHFLCGATCGIYEKRLGTCRTYRCRTLLALDASEVSLAEAQARVAQSVAQRSRVCAEAGTETLQQARDRLKPLAKAGGPIPAEHARAFLALGTLETLLDRFFRHDGQENMIDAPAPKEPRAGG